MSFIILILMLNLFLNLANSDNNSSSNSTLLGFKFDGFFKLGEESYVDDKLPNMTSYVITTDGGRSVANQVFYNFPFKFKNSTTGPVYSFSTTFIFAVVPKDPQEFSGHGLAFVVSPSKGIPGALPNQYLGLFNATSNEQFSNHIVAVELDTDQDFQFSDMNTNHLGIDINGLVSVESATAGYYRTNDSKRFRELDLKSGLALQVWVEYESSSQELNVTIHPVNIPKPKIPLLSLKKDLSSYFLEFMYIGFSSSSGFNASHYILGWSFKINGKAEEINLSQVPDIPGVRREEGGSGGDGNGDKRMRMMLAVILSITGGSFILTLIFGALAIHRRRRFIRVLEDWEVLYGPYRFTYKDLFIATKGFRDRELLGRGGFGRVYKGILPFSNVQIAVKRIAHDSRQGMREFVAEIATIGRLRHPNLVRLLGYCRKKNELFLIYDYMPNGSLDKFLYALPDDNILNWKQRFKIIRDVASALYYLHEQWIQTVIHRDMKPANVLIDNEMNARLGDFGLAKLCEHGNDPQTSHIVGTPGYIAPELVQSGKSNTCTDLYAFGICMLEITCGRRPVDPRNSPEKVMLIDWVLSCWDSGNILETVDSRLGSEYSTNEAELILKLGLLCSHPMASVRPSISGVIQFLDGVAQLPDNLTSMIKFQDFDSRFSHAGGIHEMGSSEQISIPTITITESFAYDGR